MNDAHHDLPTMLEALDRHLTYILDEDGRPAPCDDPITWAMWMGAHGEQRRIAEDQDEGVEPGQSVRVSTIFTGVDMGLCAGPPVLWETMIFGGPLDLQCQRYASLAEALAGHQVMCARVKESQR